MSRIEELNGEIRDLINAPRKHAALLKDPAQYYKLCSCLDAIGDTELAFGAYEQMLDSPRPGSSYILAYGFLQALFVQQDAVRHLHEALGICSEPDTLLDEIRELRNDSAGHPTKRGRGKGNRFNFISRMSIRKSGFQLMSIGPNHGLPRFRPVSLRSLLDTQHSQLEKALRALLQELQKEEMKHKEGFKNEKLEKLFAPVLPYYFEKVYESIRSKHSSEYGAMHVSLIREIVEQFLTALADRQIAFEDSKYLRDKIGYPSDQLIEYFTCRGEGRLNTKDAAIFTSFLQNEISRLKELAREIDAEYGAG